MKFSEVTQSYLVNEKTAELRKKKTQWRVNALCRK